MVKKAKKRAAKKAKKASVAISSSSMLELGMNAIAKRAAHCNKAPIKWLKQADGSWLECFLRSDCTYGNCHEVSASKVPAEIRNA